MHDHEDMNLNIDWKNVIPVVVMLLPFLMVWFASHQGMDMDESYTVLISENDNLLDTIDDVHHPIAYRLWRPFTRLTQNMKPGLRLYLLRMVALFLTSIGLLIAYQLLKNDTERVLFALMFAANEMLVTRLVHVRYYAPAFFFVMVGWFIFRENGIMYKISSISSWCLSLFISPFSLIPIALILFRERYWKEKGWFFMVNMPLSAVMIYLLSRKVSLIGLAPRVYYEFHWVTVIEYITVFSAGIFVIGALYIAYVRKGVWFPAVIVLCCPLIVYILSLFGMATSRYLAVIAPVFMLVFAQEIASVWRMDWLDKTLLAFLSISLAFTFLIVQGSYNGETPYESAAQELGYVNEVNHLHLTSAYPLAVLLPGTRHIVWMNESFEQGTLLQLAFEHDRIIVRDQDDYSGELPLSAWAYTDLINRSPDNNYYGLGVWKSAVHDYGITPIDWRMEERN